jgi:hypothetical protein
VPGTDLSREARDAQDVGRGRDGEERRRLKAALDPVELKPAAWIAASVSRVVRQPPSDRVQKSESTACCTARNGACGDRTCSYTRSSPPGARTRRISRSASAVSGTLHSTQMATTASYAPSAAGSRSANPSATSIGTAASTARSRAATRAVGSGSTASTASTSGP